MTQEIALVLGVLAVTILLFVTEVLRVDVTAIAVMLILPWLGLITPAEAFAGLAGNAVVSVLAVMIISHGIERSGVMSRLARPILRLAGTSEARILALVSGVVGLISAFMQNIGAAALFLPVMHRISRRTGRPLSRLLMPMGFAAILGGTLTLVGSGPLIILNDLLRQADLKPYGLFSVTPMGAALLGGGLLVFSLLGRFILPTRSGAAAASPPRHDLVETWKLPATVFHGHIPAGSRLEGETPESVGLWRRYDLHLLAIRQGGDITFAPWRHQPFAAGQDILLLGETAACDRFVKEQGLRRLAPDDGNGLPECALFAEFIVPFGAGIAGRTIRDIGLRKTYGVEPVMLLDRDAQTRADFSDVPLQAGSTLIVFGPCAHIRNLNASPDFRLLTPLPDDPEASARARPLPTLLCAAGAIGLALAGFNLGLALFSGALAMILLRLVAIDEAYQAVDWRTVFLLAGLIPLGTAMERSGGAAYLADRMMALLTGGHPLLLMTGIALLTTLFSLFMSNVAAAVLLVPLVVAMGAAANLNPRALALLVAVCASNSFLLPTHQVNALLMGPGGYRNADYLRAGGLMSLLFIVVAVLSTYYLYM